MNIYITLSIIALIVFVVLYVVLRKKRRSSIEARVLAITDRRATASGMRVWVENGATVNALEITAIESGLARCFEKARLRGYDRPLNLSDYIVAIVGDCERSPESQIWSYKIPATGDYKGSEWDLGGYMLIAGQVIAIGEPFGNIIALPEHQGTDLEQLAEVTMYEAEHIILCFSSPDEYEATRVHGAGRGHPLFD